MTDELLVLFEDDRAARFEPLALTRSVARLRVGLWTHRERWQHYFPDRAIRLVGREFLTPTERESGEWAGVGDVGEVDALFVAAAIGPPEVGTLEEIRQLPVGVALMSQGRLVAARPSPPAAPRLARALAEVAGEEPFSVGDADWEDLVRRLGLKRVEEEATSWPDTLVDLVHRNAKCIEEDFQAYVSRLPPPDATAHPGVHLLSPERIRCADGVRIDPGVVLDARQGPILLGPGTVVGAGTVLQGPMAAGPRCVFKPGARVMDGVSLGPVCKVGGEVDATIVQGYSNKQHDGFLGHSFLGSWVNLGAATDTSDLKNDYGEVAISLLGRSVATGSRHVGSLIGDHSKTAIHTRLNTGSVIGVSANVFGEGFAPREIPSFTWGGGAVWHEYRLEKALRVAATVTGRRDVRFGPADEDLLSRVHRATAPRRAAVLAAFRTGKASPDARKAHF